MAAKRQPQEAPSLVGKTKVEIALLVKSGALTEKAAIEFVVDRETRKFKSALARA